MKYARASTRSLKEDAWRISYNTEVNILSWNFVLTVIAIISAFAEKKPPRIGHFHDSTDVSDERAIIQKQKKKKQTDRLMEEKEFAQNKMCNCRRVEKQKTKQ